MRKRREMLPELPGVPTMHPRWEAILRGDHPLARAQRVYRRFFALLPSPWRCKFCNAPFSGPYAGSLKWIGYSPSRKNPSICARWIEWAPAGGAVVPLSVLFADIRGYTSMAEGLSAIEVTSLATRFYESGSSALLEYGGLLGQIAGDEVMALFVPGLATDAYRSKAVQAGRALLKALGYGSPERTWVEAGVGIASGEEFVGNVMGGGYKDFTALGNVTNTAARLTSIARGGEIIVDTETYAAVAELYPEAEPRELELKGKRAPVKSYTIQAE